MRLRFEEGVSINKCPSSIWTCGSPYCRVNKHIANKNVKLTGMQLMLPPNGTQLPYLVNQDVEFLGAFMFLLVSSRAPLSRGLTQFFPCGLNP